LIALITHHESLLFAGYPVFVFIHGGALIAGSSSDLGNQVWGTTLASQNEVITVTINYRLSIFGFFKPSTIKNGHFGFRDQQLALKWVQDNIAAFGGNPKRVTLGGQSAGNETANPIMF
jgi:para-nitrobenzyl esterase